MPETENHQNRRLESWKDIAEHVGRDMRTAMRWAEHGMPVHRVPGGKRGRVFAYAQEIDNWLVGAGASHSGAEGGEAENGIHDPGLGTEERVPDVGGHRTRDRGKGTGDRERVTGNRVQAGVAADLPLVTHHLPLLLRRRWQLGQRHERARAAAYRRGRSGRGGFAPPGIGVRCAQYAAWLCSSRHALLAAFHGHCGAARPSAIREGSNLCKHEPSLRAPRGNMALR